MSNHHSYRQVRRRTARPVVCAPCLSLASLRLTTNADDEVWSPGFVQRRYASAQPKPRSRTHFYDVLGVSAKSSQSEIKGAYYRLSKQHHPDINKQQGAHERFSEISEAYEILGNVHKRRLYDRGAFSRHNVHPSGRSADPAEEDYTRPFREQEGFGTERRAPPTGRTSYYNFDEFYRQHYADTIRKEKEDREWYEQLMKQQDLDKYNSKFRALVTCVLFMAMVITFMFPTMDPALKGTRQNEKKS